MFAVLLPAITTLAVLVPAGAAQALTYSCPGPSGPFVILRHVLVNTETTVTIADGTVLPSGILANSSGPFVANLTTGRFVESFTNEVTGKTIAPAENGPTWITFDPTPTVPGALATGTVIGTGEQVNLFGPVSEAALQAAGTPEPVLTFTSGLLIMRLVVPAVGIPYVTSFSLSGSQVDGCALLAG
jgi:hypothetical protein